MIKNKKIVLGVGFFLIFSLILPVNADIESPRKQMKTGISAEDILCRNGLELVIRTNEMPACVKPETMAKMQERGILLAIEFTKSERESVTVPTETGGSKIGHDFILRLYDPDANRDSKDEDRIPLSQLEFRSEKGIRTTLANPKFDANSNYLIETGPNTNIFEVQIKIPRQIDGKIMHIGEWYEIKYIDRFTPSNTDEKVVLKNKIG